MWLTDKAQVERVMKWNEASDQATVGKALGEMWSSDLRDRASIKSPVLLVAALGQAAAGAKRDKLRAGYKAQVEKIADHKVVFAEEAKHFIMFDVPKWLWKEMKTFLAEQEAEGRDKE